MDSHHAVSPRFAHHASNETRSRRIIHGGEFNNRPLSMRVTLHSGKAIEGRATLVHPDGVRGADQAERHTKELVEAEGGWCDRQTERADRWRIIMRRTLCAAGDLYERR
jgi:hypothetical protein